MTSALLGHSVALIGHTGFVGSNLDRQLHFTARFNSGTIGELAGQSFDTIVCSGVRAVKWMANREPEADWAAIEQLLGPLSQAKARRLVLISTIDVYADPVGVDEDTPPPVENHAYGRHRLRVEEFVREHFPVHHIIRLPGLFGTGLKKNVIFDLIHANCLEMIQPASAFQYYDLEHVGADLLKVVGANLPLVNIATEPVATQAILDAFAPGAEVGAKAGPVGRYDFRSKHAPLWRGEAGRDGYLYDSRTVLAEIGAFMAAERKRLA